MILPPQSSRSNLRLISWPGGTDLGTTDACFELLEEFGVAGGELEAFLHQFKPSTKIGNDNRHCCWQNY